MSLRRRVLDYLRSRLGGLPLRLIFWDGGAFDFAPEPRITLTMRSRRLARWFLTGNMAALGGAYVSGELEVHGRVEDVLMLGIGLAERIGQAPLVRRLGPLLARRRRHSKASDAADIRYHYDVSNDFYRLWLDRHMVYSCAYFITGTEGIDTAQEQKLDHLCRKLRLSPGERLLDIGCGWGGLVCWAAERYGVSAVGVTLSERQVEYAEERIRRLGLSDRVKVRLQDYRDIPGEAEFDKIVSVGMYEHVGIANLPLYFATIARLLKPGGLALNHGITSGDRDGQAQGPPGGEFIDKYVFPGGELPHRRGSFTRSPGPGWRSSISRICGRITRERCCIGCADWRRTARRPSPRPVPSATVSGASICRGWPMPSTADGSRSRNCWL